MICKGAALLPPFSFRSSIALIELNWAVRAHLNTKDNDVRFLHYLLLNAIGALLVQNGIILYEHRHEVMTIYKEVVRCVTVPASH